MNQEELIYNYSKSNKPFTRLYYDDDDTIEELKMIINSCQRNYIYKISVLGYKVVKNPVEINRLLKEYTDFLINPSSRKNKMNKYDYIQLKDTAVILLIVDYFVSAKGEGKWMRVPICIPRTIDKLYFYIDGCYYFTMHQIVDNSTYNNSNKLNNKNIKVTNKLNMGMINAIRESAILKTVTNEEVPCSWYKVGMTSIYIPGMLYILARYGLVNSMRFLGFKNSIIVTDYNPNAENMYTFLGGQNIYISVYRYIYDNELTIQSYIHSILSGLNQSTEYESIFTNEYWYGTIATKFTGKYDVIKGFEICTTLENVYDDLSKYTLKLPEEDKANSYTLLRWMFREFQQLRNRDNQDVCSKRMRKAGYYIYDYMEKLVSGFHRLAKKPAKNITVGAIEKILRIRPDFIPKKIVKSTLVSYRDNVNDLDIYFMMKWSYKGSSGLNKKAPEEFKRLHPSHIGKFDKTAANKSTPGITGSLVPYIRLGEKGYLDESFEEPNGWRSEYEATFVKAMEEAGKTVLSIPSVDLDQSYTNNNYSSIMNKYDLYPEKSCAYKIMTKEELEAYESSSTWKKTQKTLRDLTSLYNKTKKG